MRRWLFLLLMVVALTVCAAFAEDAEWVYSPNQGGIGQYNGEGGDVIVPETAEGQTVRALGDALFSRNSAIISLTVPSGVRSIGSNCLNNCSNLESVVLSEGLQSIEYNNFMTLPKLSELTIPSTVTLIDYSINWCDQLKKVTFLGECPVFSNPDFCFSVLPEDLVVYVPDDQLDAYRTALINLSPEQIQPSGQNAVKHSWTPAEEEILFDAGSGTITGYTGDSLRVDFPAEIGGVPVTAIGKRAFADSRLAYVNIPEGVVEIGNMAFDGAEDLRVICLPDSLKTIGEYAFNSTEANMIRWGSGLETIGDDAFRYTSIGAELHLPESLRVIGMEAFKGATLRNVYIGGNITSIGANAFNRTNLNYLAIDAYHVIDVGEDAFAGTWLEDVDLPWDSDQENQQAWQALIDSQVEGCKVWINNPEDCDLPETGACSYDYYADGTMYVTGYEGERENLVLYHTMDGVQVTGIGDGAFKGNQTVKKYRVTHNDTFTTIGAEAFAESAVEVVDLYYTTETIGAGAFRDCLGLTEITLPASLKSVGEGAFSGCVNLAKVNILCDPAIIPADAFAGTAYAAAPIVEMPFEATAEADFEFDAETGTIVGYIGDDVDVVIPRAIGDTTVRAIGYNAFERARDYTDTDIATNQTSWLPLRSVVIPETVEEIADSAFSYCQQLELVICYAPLSSTGRETFLVCRSLRDVLFVNGVSEIDNYCFESCDMLQHVYWGDHLRRIGVNAFNRVGLMSLVIDAEIVDEGAFNHSDLWDVTLTDRVREIHSAAFYACENLNYITCLFSDADRFVDGAPFGGVPQTGVTTTFPAATTEEQLKDLNAKLNVWNGGHLGSGNEITLEDPYIFVDEMPDPEEIYARVTSQSVPSVISLEPERPLVLPDPIGVIDDALGVWKLSVMAEDGEEYDVSLFGIDMTLSLSGDHSVSLISEDEQQGEWYLQDGVLYIGIDGDSVPAGLDRAGRLYLVQDGAEMYFLRESAADAPEPVTDGGDEDSFVPVRAEQYMPMLGEWHGIWVATAVEQLNPQTAWDYDMILNVYEDGTARLDEDALQNLQSYNGYVMLGWQPLTLLEDGRYLQLGDTLSGSMYYARDPGEELPDKYKNALQEAQEAIRATEVPQPTVSPAAVTQAAPGSYQLDVKYLAISYSAGGVTVDASVLPEYAITLHDGGQCDFIMGGYAMPGTTWQDNGDGTLTVDYMGAMTYYAVLNGDALEIDMGGMIMHYEARD